MTTTPPPRGGPILFRDDMMRALLTVGAGGVQKCRTWRRLSKAARKAWEGSGCLLTPEGWPVVKRGKAGRLGPLRCHLGERGGLLWTREVWRASPGPGSKGLWRVVYRPDGATQDLEPAAGWKPSSILTVPPKDPAAPAWASSLHFPRWACRAERVILEIAFKAPESFTEQEAREEGFASLADFHEALGGMHNPGTLKERGWALHFRPT